MIDRGEGKAGRISAAISPPYCTKKHTATGQCMNINAPGRFFHDLHEGANGRGGLDCGEISTYYA